MSERPSDATADASGAPGSMATGPREWDADVYHRSSDFQLELGREVLDRLALRGDEAALDAGCGTGRVTLALAERLPRGRVIAVDASADMVRRARADLPDRCEVRQADLLELTLDRPVDAILSTAVFHWIDDHHRLFSRLHDALRPGGRLAAQCGGEGNVERVRGPLRDLSVSEPFAEHLSDWVDPWLFPSPEQTSRRLARAGFTDVSCWLEPRELTPEHPHEYLRTVTLGFHLARLPEELHDRFVDAVVERLPQPPTLDYVRLNIDARRP